MKKRPANALIKETSPYLLQHAYNPVAWYAWSAGALEKARSEGKLLLISIGYAACHWCHVMEEESFEDEEVAELMNRHFVSIKIDREERPDLDHIYMDALQLMTGSGGWPLNVVALPDGRPVWGGTYFRKEQWMEVLNQLVKVRETAPDSLETYAARLEEGLAELTGITAQPHLSIDPEAITKAVSTWASYFDEEYGGARRAPKFMMPVTLTFLLHYATKTRDKKILEYVETTLTKMAYGGVFDAVGGGFSRYSTDEKWHIPHFEKMLYDNAQLVSLYSYAYQATKNDFYKEVAEKTLAFIARELTHSRGAFFSSLDADSVNEEGRREEGAFYTWEEETLRQALKEDFELFADYYNINAFGLWEDGKYVLIRKAPEEHIAQKHHSTVENVRKIIAKCNRLLFTLRNKRNKPALDDKTLTSWNALMLKGYADAYKAFGNKSYLEYAVKNADFLLRHQYREDGGLYRTFKNGKSTINGFLEDYAAVCDAFLTLYEASCDTQWLDHCKALVHYCFDYFYDEKSGFFFFTSSEDPVVVTRTIEKADNVIPASNSILAKVLFKLAHYYQNGSYRETAETMLLTIKNDMLEHPYNYANWLDLALYANSGFYEIAIIGPEAKARCKALTAHYLPDTLLAVSTEETELPLLKHRFVPGETLLYVCRDTACGPPATTVKEAMAQLRNYRKTGL